MNHGRNLDDDIAKSFRMFDIDGDGLITEEELQVCQEISWTEFLK